MFYHINFFWKFTALSYSTELSKYVKKQIAEAKTIIYFKFDKIFREQLLKFWSNNLYNEFQQSNINKDIWIKQLRPCQIHFLFSVTRAHAKILGILNLFTQKLTRRSFLFIIGEKKNSFHVSI